ncbi:hypothetical protein Mycsm_02676 [Mycobacterium sp. JS623]|uniref:hypothetical protein n=1 Tax=Mycobacterium sp. JS623 TaxID=212767 RepID=UPI0002A5B1CB|nr:hypothetical protein [Mycobacterium sp. JS623]AGB23009.1 hypothetical protein Mycsm_02676 [Mycobacterium sp. JS623]
MERRTAVIPLAAMALLTVGCSTIPVASGLPAYTTPPPDTQGNPPCQFGVGWSTHYGGSGGVDSTRVVLDKTGGLGVNSSFIVLPDHYVVVVQTKDGHHHTQEAYVGREATGNWDTVAEKDFLFPDIDPADVAHVVMTTSKGTCWVDGSP